MSQKKIFVGVSPKAFDLADAVMIFGFFGFFIALGVGFYLGVVELRYLLHGSTAVATINHESYESRRVGGHRLSNGYLTSIAKLEYTFREESGLIRREYAEIDCYFLTIGRDKTVLVQYIPGVRNVSRVKVSVYSYAQRFLLETLLMAGVLIIVAALCNVWYWLENRPSTKERSSVPAGSANDAVQDDPSRID